jgi:hypothetical protein
LSIPAAAVRLARSEPPTTRRTRFAGSATLHVGGETFQLEPGVFARVAPNATRKITTGNEACRLLAIGGTPGVAYAAPAFTEEGAPLPG